MPEIWGTLGQLGLWVSASTDSLCVWFSEELGLGMEEFLLVKKKILSLTNLCREI